MVVLRWWTPCRRRTKWVVLIIGQGGVGGRLESKWLYPIGHKFVPSEVSLIGTIFQGSRGRLLWSKIPVGRILGWQREWDTFSIEEAALGQWKLVMQERLEPAAWQELLAAGHTGWRWGCALSLSCGIHPGKGWRVEREKQQVGVRQGICTR